MCDSTMIHPSSTEVSFGFRRDKLDLFMNVCVMVMVLVYGRGGLLMSSLTSTHFAG